MLRVFATLDNWPERLTLIITHTHIFHVKQKIFGLKPFSLQTDLGDIPLLLFTLMISVLYMYHHHLTALKP